ncbi:MAG: glycerophosphodiester phosphodiesterase family protein, partial [Bacteroidetes bacterium]|nr:glycerophosphodiester phosphodiesterase family protein [Bacteroidota bacterium]
MEDAFKHTKYIEIDLKLSKDSQYVLFHDHSALSRVTNAVGMVENYTVAQLKSFDAGIYMGSQFKGATVLTLVEAMQMAEKWDGYLYLDVAGLDYNLLAKEVKAAGCSTFRILPNVTSIAKATALRTALNNCPWVWYNGGLYPDTIASSTWYKNCVAIGCVAFEVGSYKAGDSAWSMFEGRVHQAKSEVWAFTENDSDLVNRLVRYKVDGIENDRPWEIARTVCQPNYNDVFPDSLTTGNWTFKKDLQSTGIGSQLRNKNYQNPPAGQTPVFKKCSQFGIAKVDATDPVVMFVPKQDSANGILVLNNFTPQDYGSENRQYSVIMDFLMPDTLKGNFVSLYQTTPTNNVDASLFINNSGQIGVWGAYYGHVDPGKWYRLAFTADVRAGYIKLYLDGKYLGDCSISTGSRWAVLNFVAAKESQGFLLFADDDKEVAPMYVNSLQIRDYVLDSATIRAMGGPSTTPLPIGNADMYNVKVSGMVQDSSLFDYDHQIYYITVAPGTNLTNATLSYDLTYGATSTKSNNATVDLSSGYYTTTITSEDKSKVKK